MALRLATGRRDGRRLERLAEMRHAPGYLFKPRGAHVLLVSPGQIRRLLARFVR